MLLIRCPCLTCRRRFSRWSSGLVWQPAIRQQRQRTALYYRGMRRHDAGGAHALIVQLLNTPQLAHKHRSLRSRTLATDALSLRSKHHYTPTLTHNACKPPAPTA